MRPQLVSKTAVGSSHCGPVGVWTITAPTRVFATTSVPRAVLGLQGFFSSEQSLMTDQKSTSESSAEMFAHCAAEIVFAPASAAVTWSRLLALTSTVYAPHALWPYCAPTAT